MSSRSLVKFLLKNKPLLLLRMFRNLEEMYRAAFVLTLVSEGIAEQQLIPNFNVFTAS